MQKLVLLFLLFHKSSTARFGQESPSILPNRPVSSYRPTPTYQTSLPYQTTYQPLSPYNQPLQYGPRSQYNAYNSRLPQPQARPRGPLLTPTPTSLTGQPQMSSRIQPTMYPSRTAASPPWNSNISGQFQYPPSRPPYRINNSTQLPTALSNPVHSYGAPRPIGYPRPNMGPIAGPYRPPPRFSLPRGGGNSFGNRADLGGNFAMLLTPHHTGSDMHYRYTDHFLNNVNKGMNGLLHYIRSKDDGKSNFNILSAIETASKLSGSLGPLLNKLNLGKIFGKHG